MAVGDDAALAEVKVLAFDFELPNRRWINENEGQLLKYFYRFF